VDVEVPAATAAGNARAVRRNQPDPFASKLVVDVNANPPGSTVADVANPRIGSAYAVVEVTPAVSTLEVTNPKSGFNAVEGIVVSDPPGGVHHNDSDAPPASSRTSTAIRCHPTDRVIGAEVFFVTWVAHVSTANTLSIVTRTLSSAWPAKVQFPAVVMLINPDRRPEKPSLGNTAGSGDDVPQFHDAAPLSSVWLFGAPKNADRAGGVPW